MPAATKKTGQPGHVLSALAPIENPAARTLILGSMPGAASLQAQQYYAHPQNAFWPIMLAMHGDDRLTATEFTYENRIKLIKNNGIALWDVLQECIRPGSLDARIVLNSAVCNDFEQFLQQHPRLRTIAFNGKTAEQLFRKRVAPNLTLDRQIQLVGLPSSSPAMATLSRAEKIARWKSSLITT